MKTIEVTDEQYDFLVNLSKELQIQDNRITANPIFCVYEEKIAILPDGYGKYTAWFSTEGHPQTEEEIKELIAEYKNDHPDSIFNDDEILEDEFDYKQFDYNIEEIPVNGQYYFSEKAAQNHIEKNNYHYHKPFVFAESAWRNYEWQTIREIILSLLKNT